MKINRITFFNNLKNTIAICCALMLWTKNAIGQDGEMSSRMDNPIGVMDLLGRLGNTYKGGLVTCKQFFEDTVGKENIHFKTAIMIVYNATDSIPAHKRYLGKNLWVFNKYGSGTAYMNFDSLGKCVDSSLLTYNKSNNLTGMCQYQRHDSDKVLKKMVVEAITRDANGQIKEDSTWNNGNSYSFRSIVGPSSGSVDVVKYDDKGNCISHVMINNGTDTSSVSFLQYDSKNRMIVQKSSLYNHQWTTNYKKYDDSSNVIEESNFSSGDSTKSISTFDSKNRLLTSVEYDGDRVKSKTTWTYNADGSYTQEVDEYSQPEGISTCEKEDKTTTQYDRYKNPVSMITKTTQGNDMSTESVVHKYTYTAEGKMVSDTETTTKSGQYHTSKSLAVFSNKYDAHGNLLEQSSRGKQGTYPYNKIIYTYNTKDKLLQATLYTDCDGAPIGSVVNTYYPDQVTTQEERFKLGNYMNLDAKCGKDSRLLNFKVVSDKTFMEATVSYEE